MTNETKEKLSESAQKELKELEELLNGIGKNDGTSGLMVFPMLLSMLTGYTQKPTKNITINLVLGKDITND